jgi:hypothetical protein
LYHILARWSIQVFGYSAMAARLPAFLGMLVFLICLFTFVSRRLRPSYGVVAVLLVLCSPVAVYTWEARPYAVLLGFTGTALVSYQRRMERKAVFPLIACLLSFACLPLTHYYGVLIVGAFAIAEIMRTIGRKQADWQLLTGMLLAPCLTLFLLRNLIRPQAAALAHYHSQGSVTAFISGYDLFEIRAYLICIGIIAIAFLRWLQTPVQDDLREASGPGFSGPELSLAGALLALPFLGAFVSAFITHAYVPRYFIATCAGFAILICYLLELFQRRCAGVALVLTVVATVFLSYHVFQEWRIMHELRLGHDRPPMVRLLTILGKLDRPILFEDAKDYLTAQELYPSMGGRLYYAAEPELALKMTGLNTDDISMRSLAKLQPVQVVKLDDLARISEVWAVVPGPYGWLTRCLAGMGADAHLVSSVVGSPEAAGVSGISAFTTKVPRPETMAAPWCEAQQ